MKFSVRWHPTPPPARLLTLYLGFSLMLALLAVSMVTAFGLQQRLSERSVDIYHRHTGMDEVLASLRRTFWLGSSNSRDFLLNPNINREQVYQAKRAELQAESYKLTHEIEQVPAVAPLMPRLRNRVDDFWRFMEQLPDSTRHLHAHQRYDFIDTEVVTRRSAVSEVVREFAEANRLGLRDAEREFATARRTFSAKLTALLALCAFAGILTAAFSIFYFRKLENAAKFQFQQVLRTRNELEQLTSRLMQVQEDERTRLSHELHDEIGQSLATLRLEVSRAESLPADRLSDIRERLHRARLISEQIMQSVRNVALMLRPSLLDDLGLGPALQYQVEDFTRRTAILCRLREVGVAEDLPDSVRTCVYRILQEALHNIEKHSEASLVEVSIRQSTGSLRMEITDNGCGFDLESRSAAGVVRLGLLGMRERASRIQGTLEIITARGEGTRIVLQLPLSEDGMEAPPSLLTAAK